MNIIQEISEIVISKGMKDIEEVMLEGGNISELTAEIEKVVNGIGRELTRHILEETDREVRESIERKREWNVQKRGVEKTYQTIFGEVRYERTYYKHKRKKEFAYLSDLVFGIEPNSKVEPMIKIRAIEKAIDMSYEKSGEQAAKDIKLSKQSVMTEIRALGEVKKESKVEEKKEVKNIYIEADEDHVALQKGSNQQMKLIYVHEGIEKVGKNRNKLKNIIYFTGYHKSNEERWLEIADYLEAKYELEKVEDIYLSGDGARWIREGLNWIVGSKYVLDKYHISKSINTSVSHLETEKEEIRSAIWEAIYNCDKERIKHLYELIIELTEKEKKKEAVRKQKNYLIRNWDGIVNAKEAEYIGCSAEGHVSHILSARLSSRPMGWSMLGANLMANLRAYRANGGKIVDIFYARAKKQELQKKRILMDEEIVKKRLRKTTYETRGNITVLNMGKKTWLSGYLKSVRGI
jgi:hypothetical protein